MANDGILSGSPYLSCYAGCGTSTRTSQHILCFLDCGYWSGNLFQLPVGKRIRSIYIHLGGKAVPISLPSNVNSWSHVVCRNLAFLASCWFTNLVSHLNMTWWSRSSKYCGSYSMTHMQWLRDKHNKDSKSCHKYG